MDELKEKFNKLTNESSLHEIQDYIKFMIKARGFDNSTSEDFMLLLTEELGELAKEVRKSTHIKMDINQSRQSNIDKELADVFIYVLALGIANNIDVFEAFKNKEKINFNRKWK